jgi:hypothetical protein
VLWGATSCHEAAPLTHTGRAQLANSGLRLGLALSPTPANVACGLVQHGTFTGGPFGSGENGSGNSAGKGKKSGGKVSASNARGGMGSSSSSSSNSSNGLVSSLVPPAPSGQDPRVDAAMAAVALLQVRHLRTTRRERRERERERLLARGERERDCLLEERERETACSRRERETACSRRERERLLARGERERDCLLEERERDCLLEERERDCLLEERERETACSRRERDRLLARGAGAAAGQPTHPLKLERTVPQAGKEETAAAAVAAKQQRYAEAAVRYESSVRLYRAVATAGESWVRQTATGKLRIGTVFSGGGSLTRPFRDAHHFPSTRLKPVLTCTRTTLKFGICPSFMGHFPAPNPNRYDSQLFHRWATRDETTPWTQGGEERQSS